jgi:hypothetical protein
MQIHSMNGLEIALQSDYAEKAASTK